MSDDKHHSEKAEVVLSPVDGDDDMLYEEPPKTTLRDSIGVFVALVALGVIGAAGYVWLTPGLSFAELWQSNTAVESAATTESPVVATPEVAEEDKSASTDIAVSEQQATHDEHEAAQEPVVQKAHPATAPEVVDGVLAAPDPASEARCEYCGMFAHKSMSRIAVYWSDDSMSQHDSWDCAVGWSLDEGLTLAKAFVFQHDADEPHWLNAEESWFLYDTKQINGSMPPFVAAFDSDAAARAAQPVLGGEVVDFTGLMAKWEW